LVAADGVPVPSGVLVRPDDDLREVLGGQRLTFPVLIKPAWEGSSKGIRSKCLVHRPDELPAVVADLRRDYQQPILVEEFIDGHELTVGILGNSPPQILGVMRVVPTAPVARFVYSLEVKRDFRRQVRYECPPPLPPAELAAVEQAALRAFRALGCRDVARIDFRLRQGVPYFLEVNPLPGLNPESSDLVIMSGLLGWPYPRLIETILHAALERRNHESVTNYACPHPLQ
jgi:D-alanine-D-alanine ligase